MDLNMPIKDGYDASTEILELALLFEENFPERFQNTFYREDPNTIDA